MLLQPIAVWSCRRRQCRWCPSATAPPRCRQTLPLRLRPCSPHSSAHPWMAMPAHHRLVRGLHGPASACPALPTHNAAADMHALLLAPPRTHAGLSGAPSGSVAVPVTCTAATPFAPGAHTIRLAASVAAAAPCAASSTTPAATALITINPTPTVALTVQSVSTPCPDGNVTAAFAFDIAGLTAGAGVLVLDATATTTSSGTACAVLSVKQTGAHLPRLLRLHTACCGACWPRLRCVPC